MSVSHLDRQSYLLDQPCYVWTKQLTKENGATDLGLNVSLRSNSQQIGLTVISVVPNSIAFAGGIRPGDRVLAVNGQSVEGLNEQDAERLLSNTPTTVNLLLSRPINNWSSDRQQPILSDRSLLDISQIASRAPTPIQTTKRKTSNASIVLPVVEVIPEPKQSKNVENVSNSHLYQENKPSSSKTLSPINKSKLNSSFSDFSDEVADLDVIKPNNNFFLAQKPSTSQANLPVSNIG